jgi:hypothetical protein
LNRINFVRLPLSQRPAGTGPDSAFVDTSTHCSGCERRPQRAGEGVVPQLQNLELRELADARRDAALQPVAHEVEQLQVSELRQLRWDGAGERIVREVEHDEGGEVAELLGYWAVNVALVEVDGVDVLHGGRNGAGELVIAISQ